MYPNIERYMELVLEDEYSTSPRLELTYTENDTFVARITDDGMPLLCVHGDRFIQAVGDTVQEAMANLEKMISETWKDRS